VYIKHYGSIPVDSNGRKYEIHHIDGNHNNNDPSNLKAVTIQEHYDIHKAQGDYRACIQIARKMKLSAEELSELNSRIQREYVESGKHHFLGGKIQKQNANERVKNRTHHFLDSEFQRKNALVKMKNGTHNFQKFSPHSYKWKCECGKTGSHRGNETQHKRTCVKENNANI
jgi:hypothetical protein